MKILNTIRRALANDSGFTLMEVIFAVGIVSLTVGIVGAGIFQVVNTRRHWADDALATKDLRHAGSWFAGDALNAEDVLDGPGGTRLTQDCADPPANPVSTVTLTWTDTQGAAQEASYSTALGSLTRQDIVSTQTGILNQGVVDDTVGFSLCGNLLRLDLTVESDRGTTEAISMSTYLRKLVP